MKTHIQILTKLAGMLLFSAFLFLSCSKKSDAPDAPPGVLKASATFSRVHTSDYPTSFPGSYLDHITIGDEYVYVLEYESKKFRRYDMRSDQWEELASNTGLYSGISGYLTYHNTGQSNKNVLAYLGGSHSNLNIYYPPENEDASLRGTWRSESVLSSDENGERGAASDGQYLYFMGNRREEQHAQRVDRYNPNSNFWEERIGRLPEKLDKNAQAEAHDGKLYVVGESTESDKLFFIYDLQRKKGEIKAVPSYIGGFGGNYNNTLLVYQDYLIYMEPLSATVTLNIYDIKGRQWLEDPVQIEMDLFSNSIDNASLLLSSSGKLYVAGTKAGDFVLYEVDFKVTEK